MLNRPTFGGHIRGIPLFFITPACKTTTRKTLEYTIWRSRALQQGLAYSKVQIAAPSRTAIGLLRTCRAHQRTRRFCKYTQKLYKRIPSYRKRTLSYRKRTPPNQCTFTISTGCSSFASKGWKSYFTLLKSIDSRSM